MPLIKKTNDITISHTEIDRDHDAFIGLINELSIADDQTFIELFALLLAHTEAHFERENKLMAQFGFPAIAEHQGEHHRVLAEIKQFKKRVDKGMVSFGRAFITDRIPQWFTLHVMTMDSALDAHIKKHTGLV